MGEVCHTKLFLRLPSVVEFDTSCVGFGFGVDIGIGIGIKNGIFIMGYKEVYSIIWDIKLR